MPIAVCLERGFFYCTNKAKFDGISVSFVQNDVMTCVVCSSEVLLRINFDERRDTLYAYMHNLYVKSVQQ